MSDMDILNQGAGIAGDDGFARLQRIRELEKAAHAAALAGVFGSADKAAYAPKPAPFTLTFGQALDAIRAGKKATRKNWNGKGMWIALQIPDARSKMQRPYLYISTAQGELVPWVASHADLLGDDWAVLE